MKQLTHLFKATVARIVRQALRRLDELQQRVDMFLKFLIKIQDMVIIADEGKELTLDPARGREERADTDIKKVCISIPTNGKLTSLTNIP